MNPPLRTQRDIEALREALADGTIDIVATDHAPHGAETKECEWQEAAFGMLGLETALSIVNETMVATGLLNWERVAQRLSIAPARIGGYTEHGQELKIGANANITIFDPNQSAVVDRDLLASRSRNTPFHGKQLQGSIKATFFKGIPTYLAGELSSINTDGAM